jgi:hypothetical protein
MDFETVYEGHMITLTEQAVEFINRRRQSIPSAVLLCWYLRIFWDEGLDHYPFSEGKTVWIVAGEKNVGVKANPRGWNVELVPGCSSVREFLKDSVAGVFYNCENVKGKTFPGGTVDFSGDRLILKVAENKVK